jgi:hypothetical protein
VCVCVCESNILDSLDCTRYIFNDWGV